MRILSGIYKGRIIHTPKGIRPTQDNVRKALFDILGDIEGCSFLELYAGSGSVGLEAASRGVGHVIFVDKDFRNISVLKKNSEALGLKNYTVYVREAEKAIRDFHRQHAVFDIIFLDPPYYFDLAKNSLQTLGAYDIVAPTGFLIVQHFRKDRVPEKVGKLELFRQNYYGDTVLSLYNKRN